MTKPTEPEIIDALERGLRSLLDAQAMTCTDELPTLYEDVAAVAGVLKRLKGI